MTTRSPFEGNVMAAYSREQAGETNTVVLLELHVYGSSRLGMVNTEKNVGGGVGDPTFGPKYSRYLGEKRYELSNHLGNVLEVITDRRFQIQETATGYTHTVKYYEPDIVTMLDYDPFGMILSARFENNIQYRYGYNGKECDLNSNDYGSIYDYGFRIYDARIGRFLSVDPLTFNYPYYTPYQFASNNPIRFIDLDGLEGSQPETSPAFSFSDDVGTWVSWDGNVWYYQYHDQSIIYNYVYFKDDNLLMQFYKDGVVLDNVVISPSLPIYLGEESKDGWSKADWKFQKQISGLVIDVATSFIGGNEAPNVADVALGALDANGMDFAPIPIDEVLNDDEMLAYGFLVYAMKNTESLEDFTEEIIEANKQILQSDNNAVEVFVLSEVQYNAILNGGLDINGLDEEQRIDPSGLIFEMLDNQKYQHIIFYRHGDDGSSLPSGSLREYSRSDMNE